METNTVTLPTYHLGGSSAATMLESYCTAMDALRNAIDAVIDCCPNGRDYLCRDADFQRAVTEHSARIDSMRSVYADIETLAIHASDAKGE